MGGMVSGLVLFLWLYDSVVGVVFMGGCWCGVCMVVFDVLYLDICDFVIVKVEFFSEFLYFNLLVGVIDVFLWVVECNGLYWLVNL